MFTASKSQLRVFTVDYRMPPDHPFPAGLIERIWRREGLKVSERQPKRRRLWLGDGSCIRLRPQHRGHVWSYDFVEDRTHKGRTFRMLNIPQLYTQSDFR